MRIRKVVLKDIPSIIDLSDDFMRDHSRIVLKGNRKFKPHIALKKNANALFRKHVAKQIRSKDGDIFVVDDNGALKGYMMIFIKKNISLFKLRRFSYISDLYLRKGVRGRRLSSMLKDAAIRWSRKRGVKYISLAVFPQNKLAHSVYKRWGFFDFHIEMRRKI